MGTWTPGCVIRGRLVKRDGTRLYTRPASVKFGARRANYRLPKIGCVDSTSMMEDHFRRTAPALLWHGAIPQQSMVMPDRLPDKKGWGRIAV